MSTEHSGPAMQNRAQHFQMQPGEPTLATLEETLSGCADNISHLHGWRRHLLGLGGPATVAEDGQRIQRADGRIEVSLRNVQINRGLFNVAVTQQHLNGFEVHSFLEPMGRYGVPDRVRSNLCCKTAFS